MRPSASKLYDATIRSIHQFQIRILEIPCSRFYFRGRPHSEIKLFSTSTFRLRVAFPRSPRHEPPRRPWSQSSKPPIAPQRIPPTAKPIILPNNPEGVKATEKARARWSSELTRCKRPLPEQPAALALWSDRGNPSEWAYEDVPLIVHEDAIVFPYGDRLGEYLWRLAHPGLSIPFPPYTSEEWSRWYESWLLTWKQSLAIRRWVSIWLVGWASWWGIMGYIWFSNREQVPVTGRDRFSLYDHALYDPGRQKRVDELHKKPSLPATSREMRLCIKVLQRLLPVSGWEHLNWEIIVRESLPDEFNATVSPSGLVVIDSQILHICQAESGLATLLSHEIAHNIAGRHAELRNVKKWLWIAAIPTLPLVLPSVVLGSVSMFWGIATMTIPWAGIYSIPGVSVGLGLQSYYYRMSRVQEIEADYIGLIMMAKAGYDIREAPYFWTRMHIADRELKARKDKEGKVYVQNPLAATHPHTRERIKQIVAWIPKVLSDVDKIEFPRPAERTTDEY